MQFRTLDRAGKENVRKVFNEAFADYEIPIQRTAAEFEQKLAVEDIDLSLSAGAYDGDMLVGFILLGVDDDVQGIKTAWDGGTGVIAAYRGQRLTQRMFEYILPVLRQHGVQRVLLEVLENNIIAYKIYEQLGFRKTRKLNAYRGNVEGTSAATYDVTVLPEFDEDLLPRFGDFQLPWQQMNKRVRNWGNAITTIGIRKEGKLVAYAHYNDVLKRVLQFAVKREHRREGMAAALFRHMAGDNAAPLTVINVEDSATNTGAFLKAIGVNYFISQYEMEKDIS